MSTDPTYELLTPDTVPGYVLGRPALAARLAEVTGVREVGDGNLNLVFIVSGRGADGRPASLVVKQALPYVRADPTWPMSPTRNHAEARALAVHGALAPDVVPALYDADPTNFAFTVEDLSDHRVWRGALVDGQRHEGVATALGRYVAEIAFGTSALTVDAEALKGRVAEAVNPPLCKITELLVFTAPYTAEGRETVAKANRADAAAYADDPDVVAAIGAAKWNFMTRAEALIHGDLHSGSVMVRAADGSRRASTKAFDSEFAFYGPIGFDLGLLAANLTLAAARSAALDDADEVTWRLSQIGLAWDAFESRWSELWPSRIDPTVWTDRFREQHLARIRRDLFDAAAAETARRVLGPYPVADIETLDAGHKVRAVRGALATARHLLLATTEADAVGAVFTKLGDLLAG